MLYSDAGTGGARGATGPPNIWQISYPIRTGEGRLSPPITTGTPNVFHLPASLFKYLFLEHKQPLTQDHSIFVVMESNCPSKHILHGL